LSFFGALFLCCICILPDILNSTHTQFGGTSMLILVSVSIRVMMNVQSYLYSDKLEMSYKAKGKYSGSGRRF
jgi:preprotein translocase subunit SecY